MNYFSAKFHQDRINNAQVIVGQTYLYIHTNADLSP